MEGERHALRRAVLALAAPTALWLGALAMVSGCGGGGSGSGGGGGGGGGGGNGFVVGDMVVFAYNDLGMHCMNQDFSEIQILPPFNTLHAQVVDRSGDDPAIVQGGVSVTYALVGNTHSADKTNFWQYASGWSAVNAALLANPAPNVGLTGNGLSGAMSLTGDNDWVASGIPVTPMSDSGVLNPYPLAAVTVTRSGQPVAQTRTVVPVSWEMRCDLCHNTQGVSTATDILRAHDRLHGTTLEQHKPVVCAKCHSDNAVGSAGQAGVPSLSHAMHGAHASRMGAVNLPVTPCYACHPGQETKCLRDVHYAKGMTCTTCHGPMASLAATGRRPWLDEPRCGDCHNKAGFEFEQPGTLYRNSKGHHGIHCEACHGSPHAVTPTVTAVDNQQAIGLQGHAGTIDTCTLCHRQRPDDAFPHRLSGD